MWITLCGFTNEQKIADPLNLLYQKIEQFFKGGHARSQKAKKHIFISLAIKFVSLLVGFVLTPMILGYLGDGDPETAQLKYGIWVTLYAIIEWIGYLDLGIGHGLRNKFAESRAKGDNKLARVYVSSAYSIFAMIFGAVLLVFFVVNHFVDWSVLLNAPASLQTELNRLIVFVVIFFSMRMVINLVSVLLIAEQRPSIAGASYSISNIISLGVILLLGQFKGSLFVIGIVLSASPVVVSIMYSLYFYTRDLNTFRPSIKFVDRKYFKSLTSLGFRFFVIQIAVLVIFSTDSLIITRINGPAEVTPYNLAWRYFNMATVIFNLIVLPFWSAYTEAYIKEDFDWIRKTNKGLMQVWGLFAVGIVIMISISTWFYKIWVGPEYEVPFLLSLFMGVFILISSWNNVFANFLNGTGKIKLQLVVSIFMALGNIPLSILLDKYAGLGVTGVILATCITLFPGVILNPIQFKKIVNKTDYGIWGQ